ncbi:GMC oxidoreductase-domain-containing protein [Vararia minispora EC-137]|uniref:GMC oxidoreductase-domain-containing protein n=1 Tax=Vararia minispora EC-137 TaxID=1314806 RepID=A0ACB8Q8G3_9AGAM|nr:GMC oxidoreductase-domain-containing protein [Vararia minispora EC-137]
MAAFGRNPIDIAPFNTTADPSAGHNTGHYQLAFADFYAGEAAVPPSTGGYFTIITIVRQPASVGNITLSSISPFEQPLINANLLGEYYDVATMREALKAAIRVAQSPALSDGFIAAPFGALAEAVAAGATDGALEAFARNFSGTSLQPSGSTRMTRVGGTDGVLDPTLKVVGTIGLRVVDAGSMPFGPSASCQAGVYVLAERAADIIKADALP